MARDCELLIVGGGIAGLTAGLHAARARLDAVLIERMGTGGQLLNVDRVENYPGFPDGIAGFALGPLVAQQAMDAGLPIEYDDVSSIAPDGDAFAVATYGGTYRARSVILAMGSHLAKLGVPGEAELEGSGVSYCATCDGAFFKDQPVVVVGGGDSAVDEATYLTGIAAGVTLVHRREALRAERLGAERLLAHPKVRVLWDATVTRIMGDETVTGVEVQPSRGGPATTLDASGVFIYTGLLPSTAWLDGFVELDAGGHIVTGARLETSVPGIFAAGDVRQHSARQASAAAGDGATAAIWAERHLRGPLAR